MNLNLPWSEFPIVAFDTETSGAYPIESEIIELGAVKWHHGQIIGKFQTLLKPSKPLVPENIRIHGITNEMVQNAPFMKEQILKFCEFIDGSILLYEDILLYHMQKPVVQGQVTRRRSI